MLVNLGGHLLVICSERAGCTGLDSYNSWTAIKSIIPSSRRGRGSRPEIQPEIRPPGRGCGFRSPSPRRGGGG